MAWFRRPASDGAYAGRRGAHTGRRRACACACRQGDIAAHVLGFLDGEERTRLVAHLLRCRGCRAAHDELVPLRDWLNLLSWHDIVML